MSQTPPSPRRSSRWSWIRVSELVGVLALVIAALGFWDNHREHKLAEQARLEAEQQAGAARTFVLIGAADGHGDRISLRPAHDDQVIQSQTFVFPTALHADVVNITGNARIERQWFEVGLRNTVKLHGREVGDLRLPIGISTTYLVDGDTRVDQAIYDIGYRLERSIIPLAPSKVVLEGLSVARRGVSGDLQAATDKVFVARGGAPKP